MSAVLGAREGAARLEGNQRRHRQTQSTWRPCPAIDGDPSVVVKQGFRPARGPFKAAASQGRVTAFAPFFRRRATRKTAIPWGFNTVVLAGQFVMEILGNFTGASRLLGL